MTVETVASVVAALGAVGALYYANDTVRLAIKDRKDASERHTQQIAEMKAATAESKRQHEIEMVDRRRLADADERDRQLNQLERISDLLLNLIEATRAEMRPRPKASQVPAMCIRLDNAAAALAGTGLPHPDRTTDVADKARHDLPREQIIGLAVDALYEINQMTLDVGAGVVPPQPGKS